jgi:DNA-binding NarL/FixJ family response regulator
MAGIYRTLLVEDDAPLRSLNRAILERSGRFNVVGEAGDGDVGAILAGRLQPDVVLLDLAMPRHDGFDALPRIRAAAPAARVIAVSMLQRDKYAPEALQKGAIAFVDKGADSQAFVAHLLDILEGKQSGGSGSAGGGAKGRALGASGALRFPGLGGSVAVG